MPIRRIRRAGRELIEPMFTGLVEAIGTVRQLWPRGTGAVFCTVATELEGLGLGHSVSVSGVCVTITQQRPGEFGFLISAETLRRSIFGSARPGLRVNLERAARPSDRLGGHIVLGHVDEVGRVDQMRSLAGETRLRVAHSGVWEFAVVEKGSVAINGVSLTIAESDRNCFTVSLIPYTLQHTTLGDLKNGDCVNVEFDILAKYVAKSIQSLLSEAQEDGPGNKITLSLLRKAGFV